MSNLIHIPLKIPESISQKYNNSLSQVWNEANTLIGYQRQMKMLNAVMFQNDNPNAILLGEQGIGKTALVEQWVYDRAHSSIPVCVVCLNLEQLGTLPINETVARINSVLEDMKIIEEETKKNCFYKNFQMILFIDEIHKLNFYGKPAQGRGSSSAMNALKEGLARGKFPFLGATTDYEYGDNIAKDLAFDRRLGKIIMQQPDSATTVKILERKIASWREQKKFVPEKIEEKMLYELVKYTDAFVPNQVNPAKSLHMLEKAVSFCSYDYHLRSKSLGKTLNHEYLALAFDSESNNIDPPATAQHVKDVVAKQVLGQPLAVQQISQAVNMAIYTMRNYKKPLMTAFLVGSTGTGKSQTAKALAEAFFGRQDALLVINGGDYPTAESALEAQHFIGDKMRTNKQIVILLDELEKSHKSVLNSYMRMLDDGIVRDSEGVERSVNTTVIIATSNLGADVFSELKDRMQLDLQSDPNQLTERIESEWFRKKEDIKKALQEGDPHKNNGIRPEIIERFGLLIPYFPLAKKTMALIARRQLEKFSIYMKTEKNITVQLPKPFSHEKWVSLMKSESTPYGNDDPVSVMIPEDVVGVEAKSTGARAIINYITMDVQAKVANAIAFRKENGLTVDGVFRLSTNGNAQFESPDRERPAVSVVYENAEKAY